MCVYKTNEWSSLLTVNFSKNFFNNTIDCLRHLSFTVSSTRSVYFYFYMVNIIHGVVIRLVLIKWVLYIYYMCYLFLCICGKKKSRVRTNATQRNIVTARYWKKYIYVPPNVEIRVELNWMIHTEIRWVHPRWAASILN